jgi:hypothetical protein
MSQSPTLNLTPAFVGTRRVESAEALRNFLENDLHAPSRYYFLRWLHRVSGFVDRLPEGLPSPAKLLSGDFSPYKMAGRFQRPKQPTSTPKAPIFVPNQSVSLKIQTASAQVLIVKILSVKMLSVKMLSAKILSAKLLSAKTPNFPSHSSTPQA